MKVCLQVSEAWSCQVSRHCRRGAGKISAVVEEMAGKHTTHAEQKFRSVTPIHTEKDISTNSSSAAGDCRIHAATVSRTVRAVITPVSAAPVRHGISHDVSAAVFWRIWRDGLRRHVRLDSAWCSSSSSTWSHCYTTSVRQALLLIATFRLDWQFATLIYVFCCVLYYISRVELRSFNS